MERCKTKMHSVASTSCNIFLSNKIVCGSPFLALLRAGAMTRGAITADTRNCQASVRPSVRQANAPHSFFSDFFFPFAFLFPFSSLAFRSSFI